MSGRRDYRVVVEIEYPLGRILSISHKDIGFNHFSGFGVVAKGLYLYSIIIKKVVDIRSLIHFIRVDVKSAARQDIAESKIVASHCWVITAIKGFDVSKSKLSENEMSGFLNIKCQSSKAMSFKWLPGVKALLHISGYSPQVVPKLNTHLRYGASRT